MLIFSQLPVKTDRYTPVSSLTGLYPMTGLFPPSLRNSQTETVAACEYQAGYDYESAGCLKVQVRSALIGQMIGTDTRLNKIYRVARNNQFWL